MGGAVHRSHGLDPTRSTRFRPKQNAPLLPLCVRAATVEPFHSWRGRWRRCLFLLREHPKRGPVPLSVAWPDRGYRSSIIPLSADALETSLWSGGPALLPAVREAASRIESAVLYEPAEPTDGDRVTALLPAPLGCPTKGWARVRAGRIVSGARTKKDCAALAKARPWVPVDLGRLPPGRYVHFHEGEWLGYLVVSHKP